MMPISITLNIKTHNPETRSWSEWRTLTLGEQGHVTSNHQGRMFVIFDDKDSRY